MRLSLIRFAPWAILGFMGCTYYNTYNTYVVEVPPTPEEGDTAPEEVPGADLCQYVPLPELPFDPSLEGNSYTFDVSPEQRELMEVLGYMEDPYEFEESDTYADNIVLKPADSTLCANTGQVGVELVGQSSLRDWLGIPNFHIDLDDFQSGVLLPDGTEHVRLNNGQAQSGLMREYVALKVWKELYIAAPYVAFAKTYSNIWDEEYGPGAWAAHVVVEPYKEMFFTTNLLDVQNVWEGAGDFVASWGWWNSEFTCQWSVSGECDTEVFEHAKEAIADASFGPGFRQATESVVDWEQFFRFHCLSNITGTWDNYTHNTNNVVVAIDAEGKMILLPYSTDISGDHPWYPVSEYEENFIGVSYLSAGCASDPEGCLRDEIATCQAVVQEYRALNVPETIVDAADSTMNDLEIARDADAAIYSTVREFYEGTADRVQGQLDQMRDCIDNPGSGGGGYDSMDTAGHTGWDTDGYSPNPCWGIGGY